MCSDFSIIDPSYTPHLSMSYKKGKRYFFNENRRRKTATSDQYEHHRHKVI